MIGQGKDGKQFIINADNMKGINDGRMVVIINEGEVNIKGNPVPDWIEVAPKNQNGIIGQPGDEWIVAATTSTLLPNPKKDKSALKLERALTVPRFSRDNPPNHILVAKTGDMKRGTLLDFQGQTIQFDSKLREFSIPIDRIARVVNVSRDTGNRQASTDQSEVRVTLTDGSMLIFEPLEVQDDRLLGRSSIYGEVSVPVDSIRSLHFGKRAKSFTAAFEEWTLRPAKEPMSSNSP